MSVVEPLPAAALRRTCDPAQFTFATTAELTGDATTVGQERAMAALDFGVRMRGRGYGLYVLGAPGSGRHDAVRRTLARIAATRPAADDWCYVNDFADPQKPRALRLPPGRGGELRADMEHLIDELRAAIPAAFDSDDYRTRKNAIASEFKDRHEQAFEALRRKAEERSIIVVRTPDGLAVAPKRDGEVLSAEEFDKLPRADRQRIDADMESLRKELQDFVHQAPRWAQEQRQRLRQLDREITRLAVNHLIDALRQKYADVDAVLAYFAAVQDDVLEHANQFMHSDDNPLQTMLGLRGGPQPGGVDLRRYRVNVIADNAAASGAPVVYEDQPSHHRLVGRIEHVSQFGALVTDFTLVKPGALHRANGGYLIVDARKLLTEPFAYDALERALRSGELRIESLAERFSLVATVSLEPETMPLDVKVVLVGERVLYYLLSTLDPGFAELFKVPVDFDDSLAWNDAAAPELAGVFAALARNERLRALDRGAVARLVEHAARLAGDKAKLTAQVARLLDVVREADFWAGDAQRTVITAADVRRALDARERRSDRLRERVQEAIHRGTRLIDTTSARVGQVNGLSVTELGEFAFGMPTRITARVWLGKGNVVDIEREVELGGPIHSKGVLILTGFLGERYAKEQPLCLSASLVFEQSYGVVEGDSASLAELFALLSALAGLPLAQGLAVTGSVNQHGRVQAIGGVNEKIEGFFATCRSAGLTGEQGVLIPAANVDHLMLREDVVDAVAAGRFRILPIETVDQGIELLTGVAAGERDASGRYPEGTVNRLVSDRLAAMAAQVRAFGNPAEARTP